MDKIRLALVMCPCWTDFSPPLGIAYLASTMKSEGQEVRCYDVNIDTRNSLKETEIDYWSFSNYYLWEYQDPFFRQTLPLIKNYLEAKAEEVLAWAPDMIGLTISVTNAWTSLFFAEQIKRRDQGRKIIFGGPACIKEFSDFRFLKSGFVDVVVVGEGERTLKELLDSYLETGRLKGVEGTALKVNGEFLFGGFREEIKDLNSLPYPDFNDFNLASYKEFALPILTSRGCVGRCAFCGEIEYWRKFRFRKAGNIFGELRNDVNCYGARKIFFNDSLINGNLEELSKLVDLIIENKLDIEWGGYARVQRKMDLDLLKRLRQAGCSFLSYGIESGSQKVVDDMDKHILLKDAEVNLEDTIKAKIEAHINWIVGFPTESWMDFLKSLIFVFRNRKNISCFNPGQAPCGILPYSTLERDMDRFSIVRKPFLKNWRTKYFTNTIIHRIVRLKILRKWISLLRLRHT